MGKPIDKTYLSETLKAFDAKVLKEKYKSKNEEVEQHTHKNKEVLDALGQDSDGALLYNGNKIESGIKGDNGKSAYEIAKANGFEGTETEWLETLKGQKGDPGADGKSIKSLNKDENNNIIVTFSDNTTQNIGKLTIDVSADFLTNNGFGNIRFMDSKLQYFDANSSAWVDISVTDSNKFIINMVPQNMKKINAFFDHSNNCIKIKFIEPADIVMDGQLLCYVAGIKIVKKLGSEPVSESDGTLILDLKRKDFGKYKKNYLIDNDVDTTIGNTYYYKFFSYSNSEIINNNSENCVSITIKKNVLYGFRLDQSESDPDSMVTYIGDNTGFKSAKMNFDTGEFDYGDWEDAWFIRDLKPCMLKYDGTVDYYLDPNDYSKKEDGVNDSDIANVSYEGNAMIGIPKVYWKIDSVPDSNYIDFYISDVKIDDTYHCWAHINKKGVEIDCIYMPIYEGYMDSYSRLRSLSGCTGGGSYTISKLIAGALNNNTNEDIWYIKCFSDYILIQILLMLIGKSTQTQRIFGNGNVGTRARKSSGACDKNGLFFGFSNTSNSVKVFGMENWWSNIWDRIAGLIYTDSKFKVKLTYDTSDGSSVTDYNTDGTGYIEIPNSTFDGSSGNYIKSIKTYDELGVFIPSSLSGASATTYFCDEARFSNGGFGCIGGSGWSETKAGIFSLLLNGVSATDVAIGASVVCKPLS